MSLAFLLCSKSGTKYQLLGRPGILKKHGNLQIRGAFAARVHVTLFDIVTRNRPAHRVALNTRPRIPQWISDLCHRTFALAG